MQPSTLLWPPFHSYHISRVCRLQLRYYIYFFFVSKLFILQNLSSFGFLVIVQNKSQRTTLQVSYHLLFGILDTFRGRYKMPLLILYVLFSQVILVFILGIIFSYLSYLEAFICKHSVLIRSIYICYFYNIWSSRVVYKIFTIYLFHTSPVRC